MILKSYYDASVKLLKWPIPKATGPSNMLNPILNTSCHCRKQGFWAPRWCWVPKKYLISRCWLRCLLMISLAQPPGREEVALAFLTQLWFGWEFLSLRSFTWKFLHKIVIKIYSRNNCLWFFLVSMHKIYIQNVKYWIWRLTWDFSKYFCTQRNKNYF